MKKFVLNSVRISRPLPLEAAPYPATLEVRFRYTLPDDLPQAGELEDVLGIQVNAQDTAEDLDRSALQAIADRLGEAGKHEVVAEQATRLKQQVAPIAFADIALLTQKV